MNLAARFEQRFEASTSRVSRRSCKGQRRATGISAAVRALRMLLQSLVLALAAYLAIRQEISAGAIIATSILSSRALAPIDIAVSQWRQFVGARAWPRHASSGRLPHMTAAGRRRGCRRRRAALEVEAGFIAPPGVRTPTVAGVSFALEAGDGLAIIGPSGSGKTTLARAITGVWPLARGEITLDGAPLDQYSRRGSRRGDRLSAAGYRPVRRHHRRQHRPVRAGPHGRSGAAGRTSLPTCTR